MQTTKEIKEIIEKLDQNIKMANEQISETVQKINSTDESVRKKILEFKNDMDKISIPASNVFEKELSNLLKQYKENCAKWCQVVNSMMEGKEFINQFEKSVLIVVFGNVNVGKSSVGNIIAGTIDPDSKGFCENDNEVLNAYFGESPNFYEYDFADDTKERGATQKKESFFKEGYVETTANIQYFTRKEGMTWTDSPGICSVNWQNGDLAKKYVEFADLVIFITSSSSPAKEDEIQELKKLFGKKKPVLILINKSDNWESDEIDGEIVKSLVPKSETDRQKQEEYVQKYFSNIASEVLLKTDTVSISAHLAMESFREGNIDKFVQSGFSRFYEKLGSIFEKNALELKMNAPKQRVNAMIDEIISGGVVGAQSIMGIVQYREQLMQMQADAEKAKKEIARVAEREIPTILYECMEQITSIVQEQSYSVRKNEEAVDLKQKVDQIVTKTVASVLEQNLREVLVDYSSEGAARMNYQGSGEMKLNVKKEQTERYVYDIREVRRSPEGIIENLESFFFKKEFTRSEVKKRKVIDTFVNGDNSSELLDSIRQEINGRIQGYVREFVEVVQNQYFGHEKLFIGKILEMLERLEKTLEGEKIGNAR